MRLTARGKVLAFTLLAGVILLTGWYAAPTARSNPVPPNNYTCKHTQPKHIEQTWRSYSPGMITVRDDVPCHTIAQVRAVLNPACDISKGYVKADCRPQRLIATAKVKVPGITVVDALPSSPTGLCQGDTFTNGHFNGGELFVCLKRPAASPTTTGGTPSTPPSTTPTTTTSASSPPPVVTSSPTPTPSDTTTPSSPSSPTTTPSASGPGTTLPVPTGSAPTSTATGTPSTGTSSLAPPLTISRHRKPSTSTSTNRAHRASLPAQTVPAVTTSASSSSLPYTGSDAGPLGEIAVLLLTVGGGLAYAGRRRGEHRG